MPRPDAGARFQHAYSPTRKETAPGPTLASLAVPFIACASAAIIALSVSPAPGAQGTGAQVAPPTTTRLTVNQAGEQANDFSGEGMLSEDGRFVTFYSNATNLVPGDSNGFADVFVRDLTTGGTERISVSSSGAQGNGNSSDQWISADGRYISFFSQASNLVPGDTNGAPDVFVHDRQTGVTERVSISSDGSQTNVFNGFNGNAALSADGLHVAFVSDASNLVPGDTNGVKDVFVRDRASGTTRRVSVTNTGKQAPNGGFDPAVSGDGRYVAFASVASLVRDDTNGTTDVFVRDLVQGTTRRVSISNNETQGNRFSAWPAISADGHVVAFASMASNLVRGDTNRRADVFVRNLTTRNTGRVSLSSNERQGNHGSWLGVIGPTGPVVSVDGRFVVFWSYATTFTPNDTNRARDVFLRDRAQGITRRISKSSTGAQPNNRSYGGSVTRDGRFVAFDSQATNLVTPDGNRSADVFLRDRSP